MKRIILLFMVLTVFISILSGCASDTEKDGAQDNKYSSAEATDDSQGLLKNNEPDDPTLYKNADMNAHKASKSKANFDEIKKEACAYIHELGLNLSKYEIKTWEYSGSFTVNFYIKDMNYVTYKHTGLFVIDGQTFKFPIKCKELFKAGWAMEDPESSLPVLCKGNYKFNLFKSYTETPIEEMYAKGIYFGDYTELNNPPIVIFDNLSINSSASDILSRLGYPQSIDFTVHYNNDRDTSRDDGYHDTEIRIEYNENVTPYNNSNYLVFGLDYDKQKIILINHSVEMNK